MRSAREQEVSRRAIGGEHHERRARLGRDAAEDLVAETFLIAFQRRRGYDTSRGDARPWLRNRDEADRQAPARGGPVLLRVCQHLNPSALEPVLSDSPVSDP